jgi:hypothetical protein
MTQPKRITSSTGEPMLSAKNAARRLSCAQDYVSKLCREGKLHGTQIQGAWFVEESSIAAFEHSRAEAKIERSEELARIRREESKLYREQNGIPDSAKDFSNNSFFHAVEHFFDTLIPKLGVPMALVITGIILFGALTFAAGTSSLQTGSQVAAVFAQIDSPFFGSHTMTVGSTSGTQGSFVGNIFSSIAGFFFGTKTQPQYATAPSTPKVSQTTTVIPATPVVTPVVAPVAVTQPRATQTPIVQNVTNPVVERTVERVVSGVSEELLTSKLSELSNALKQELYAAISGISTPTTPNYASGGTTNNLALSQHIDKLDGVTITNATILNSTFNGESSFGGGGGGTVGSTGVADMLAYWINSTTLGATSSIATNIFNCNGDLETNAAGFVVCGTDQTAAGAANPFDWATNYGVIASATSSPFWAQNGVFASSTSHFAAADFQTLTSGSVTIGSLNGLLYGTNGSVGTIATNTLGLLASSSISAGSGLSYNPSTGVFTNTIGFPFTPTNSFAANANSTSTPLLLTGGLFASSTVRFGNAGVDAQLVYDGSTGKFSVGSSSPWGQFAINPTAANGTAPAFVIGSSSATDFVVTSSGNVGIGTSTPSVKLVVSSDDGREYTSFTTGITQTSYNGGTFFTGKRSRGTPQSPSPVTEGNSLVEFRGAGNDGTSFSGTAASINLTVADDWTAVAHSTEILFRLTRPDSTNLYDAAYLSPWGSFALGTTTNLTSRLTVFATSSATTISLLDLRSPTPLGLATTSVFSVGTQGSTTLFQIPSSILKTDSNGTIIAAVPGVDYALPGGGSSAFAFTPTSYGNATSTTIGFLNGLLSVGSTTINGNATTTGMLYATIASSSQLYGAGLTSCQGGNVLTWNNGLFGCATDQTAAGQANAFTFATNYGAVTAATTSPIWAQNGIFASSTSFFTGISALSATTTNLAIGSLNGPLQANNGIVSATSSIGVLYGGTGLTSAPSYGNILVGNGAGGYLLTATSSLGLLSIANRDWQVTNGYLTPTSTIGVMIFASSTIGNGTAAGGLTINGDATTTGLLHIVGANGGTSTIASNIGVTGNIVPSVDNTYSLGDASHYFKDLYLGAHSLYVNGQQVISTNGSNDVVVSTDPGENLVLQTSGVSNIELNPTGGQILVKNTVNVTAGKSFTTSDLSALLIPNGVAAGNITIAANAITATNLNGGISLTPTGSGGTYVTTGNFGVGSTSPVSKLSVAGDSYITGGLGVGVVNSTAGTLQTSGNTIVGGSLTVGSLNGLLTATNGLVSTIATSTLGLLASSSISATAPLAYNVATGVFSISQSGASTDGYLSSTDFNSFNSRLSTTTLGLFDKGYFFSTTSANNFINASTTIPHALGAAYGDVFIWNGTRWVTTATSTLGIVSSGSLSATYPVLYDSGTGVFSLAFGTTTANIWSAQQTFTGIFATNASTTNATTTNLAIGNLTGPLQAINGRVSASSSLSQFFGGTGITSYNPGDLLYANALGVLTTLPIGSNGQIIKISGNLPSWGADIASGGGGGATAWATTTDSLAVYPTDTTDVVIIGNSATSTLTSIFEVIGKSYFSNNVGIGTTSASRLLSLQGSALFSGDLSLANIIATGTVTTGNLAVGSLNGLLYGTNGSVGTIATNTLGLLASSSISATAPLSYNQATGVFSISQSGASTDGYLASTDFNSFNSRLSTTTLGLFDKGYFFSTTSTNYWLTQQSISAFSTTSAIYFAHSSTTIPKTYTNNTFTGTNSFSGLTTTGATSTGTFAVTASTTLASTLNVGGQINGNLAAVLASTTLTGNSLFTNATSSTFAITGITAGSLLKTTTGGAIIAAVAGTDYAAGNVAFPFTPSTFGTSAANATSTLIKFNSGIASLASSTIGGGSTTTGLTINGGATTTGTSFLRGAVGIGSSSIPGGSNISLFNRVIPSILDVEDTVSSTTGLGATAIFGTMVTPSANNSTRIQSGIQTEIGTLGSQTFAAGAENAGIFAEFDHNATGDYAGNGIGVNGESYNNSSFSTLTGNIIAVQGLAGSYATGNTSNIFALRGQLVMGGSGIITHASNFESSDILDDGGSDTFTNVYGLYVNDFTRGTNRYGVYTTLTAGSNNYALYNAGTAKSYFNGSVGIGTTTPLAKLSVHAPFGDTNRTLFAVASSSQSATSTLFSISNTGSTTLFQIPSSILKTDSNGTIVRAIPGTDYVAASSFFSYLFPSNATSTTLTFNAGLLSVGSTTINGNATTTGTQSVGSLFINNELFSDLTGTGLSLVGGALTNSGVTSLGPTGQTQTGDVIFATSTATNNGITSRLTIVGNSNTLTFTPSQTGILTVAGGGTGVNTFSSGQLLYGAGSGAVQSIATGTVIAGAGISLDATRYVIGGNLTVTNTIGYPFIGNATTTQIAFNGGLTATNILTTGSTTLQNFTAQNATTSQATTTNLAITGISGQILKTLTNGAVVAAVAGSDYLTASNIFAWPFTPTTYGNATSTTIGFNAGLISVGSTTINGNATSTGTFFASIASSSQLYGAGLATCNSGNVLTWNGGTFGCAADQTSTGAAAPFTYVSNFGQLTAATTSPIWAQNGIFASSSSYFVNATTSSFAITGISNRVLKTSATGAIIPAVGGSDFENPLTFNAPLTRSVDSISITQSGTGANGYLSSTDFNTFNNKISSTSLSGASVISYNSSTGVITTAAGTFGGSSASVYTFPGDLIVTGTATTSNLYISGKITGANLSSCSSSSDKLLWNSSTGQFTCGTDSGSGGGSSEINWTWFNGSGVRVSTTSNQVLIGFTSTSTLSKLEVVGGATFDNATSTNGFSVGGIASFSGNVGIGTTSPLQKFTVAGGTILQVASGNPTVASSTFLGTGSQAYATFVSGRYAYVAANASGLKILDISDPNNPAVIGTYSGISSAHSVVVSGKYAYVGDSSSGLVILDVSKPSAPSLVSSIAAGNALALAVSGRYVIFPDSDSATVNIIDTANPGAPSVIGSFTTGGSPSSIAVSGKYVYVGDTTDGTIYITDISNPATPKAVTTIPGYSTPLGLYTSGRYLYMTDTLDGLHIIDVSNPNSPSQVSVFNSGSGYYNVQVAGDYAYVTNPSGSIVVIDVHTPATPKSVGILSVGGQPRGLFVSGKYAYIGATGNTLKIVDISGTKLPAANIGALDANVANVSDNLNVGGEVYVGGGLNVGISGIFSRGGLAVFGTTTLTDLIVRNSTTTNATSTTFFATVASSSNLFANTARFTTASTSALTIGSLNGLLYGTNGSVGVISTSSLGLLSSTSIQATAPLSFNSSTGVFSISQAGSGTDGYLSSTDWNSFNGRLSTTSLGLFDKGYFFSTTSAQYFVHSSTTRRPHDNRCYQHRYLCGHCLNHLSFAPQRRWGTQRQRCIDGRREHLTSSWHFNQLRDLNHRCRFTPEDHHRGRDHRGSGGD